MNGKKYAFNGEQDPEILISLQLEDDDYILNVKDNGTGFPAGFDYKETNTLGLLIVNTLASQMQAVVTAGNNNGAEYKIKFKE